MFCLQVPELAELAKCMETSKRSYKRMTGKLASLSRCHPLLANRALTILAFCRSIVTIHYCLEVSVSWNLEASSLLWFDFIVVLQSHVS